MSSCADELRARIREKPVKPVEIARFLDGLSHAERVEAIGAMGRGEQRTLNEAVDGFGSIRLSGLVAPKVDDLVEVRHFGKNTLPMFTHFEKRFCRPREADRDRPTEIYGYNHQGLSGVTGPGYFVAREDPNRAEVLIDYRELPVESPAAWPRIRSNEAGLGRFVYGFMVDTLRRVSEHVTIGSAARHGKELGSWFLLCREE